MPKLHEDWKHLLRHAWSLRLMALAFVLTCAEVSLPLLQSYMQGVLNIPTGLFAALAGAASAAAMVARLVAQKQFMAKGRD